MTAKTEDNADTLTVDQNEAARLTKLSAKTLGRLADAGEPLGRIKVGRRVLYVRTSLVQWLASKAVMGSQEWHRAIVSTSDQS